jgi:hypothetical protein
MDHESETTTQGWSIYAASTVRVKKNAGKMLKRGALLLEKPRIKFHLRILPKPRILYAANSWSAGMRSKCEPARPRPFT